MSRNIFAVSVSALALAFGNQAQAQSSTESDTVPATLTDDDGDAIIVSGQRARELEAIEDRREALGLVDSVSSDDIGQLPDRNIAEVIERLPGVGVQYDQGEGRYVAIRGVPSNLNGYTVNGFEIGNPDGNTRRLPLDILSGQLLQKVEVFKVRTPEQIGQGIGGIVNLVPKTAFDMEKPFVIAATAQVGYQELREDDQPVKGDLTVGARFGEDEQFGILLGGSYSDRTFTSYGLYPDDWEENADAARGGVPINAKYTDYRLNRERIGATGSLDWRSGNVELYLRGLYSKFTEDEYRQRFRLQWDPDDIVFDADGVTATVTDVQQRNELRLEVKEKSVLSFMGGGAVDFDQWRLDFGVARTHNEVDEPNQSWQFRADGIGSADLDFGDVLYSATPTTGYATASQLGFRGYSEQNEQGEEDIWQGRIDLTRDLAFGGNSFFKAGANVRWTDKTFDSENTSYTRGDPGNRFALDGLTDGTVTVYPRDDRGYVIDPQIDEDLLKQFTENNLAGPLFVLDAGGTLEDGTLNDLDLEEDVYAGYAMANFDFGEIAVTAGLRAEHTKLSITGFQLENGTTVVPLNEDRDYTNWLPTVVARIKPSADTVFRLAYSRSVGRPEYADLSPGGTVGFVEVAPDVFDGEVSYGNAALKPYIADSIDVVGEWYFMPGSVLSLGAFAKFIKDPIFEQDTTLNDVDFGGRFYQQLDVSQMRNAEEGDIVGLEAMLRSQFTFLDGFWSGFGVNLNATILDGNLDVPGRGNVAFPEQSDLLWSAQLFYQRGPVEASVGYHHSGSALIGISGDELTDQYNDDFRRLDAKIAFDITPNVRIFAEGQNLTDEPTRQYQGGREDWIIQRERYGQVYWAGASVRF